MMPEFARGWEKDGWENECESKLSVMKLIMSERHSTGFQIDADGELTIHQRDLETGGIESVVLGPYKDPQTAKVKAEALMEGL